MHTNQYQHCSSHHQTSCKESVKVSCLLNKAYSIITNKDDLTKENERIRIKNKARFKGKWISGKHY